VPAVDLDHRQAPFVLAGLVECDDVRVVRQHLPERAAADRPCSRLSDHVLEAAADAELGDRARPALASGRSLVAKAAKIVALFAKEIPVTRDIDRVWLPAILVFVVQPFDASLRAHAEMVVHEVVAELTRARPEAGGPDIGRGAEENPRRVERRRTEKDDLRFVVR